MISATNGMAREAALLKMPTARPVLLLKVAALWTRMIWATFASTPRSTWVGAKRLIQGIYTSGLLFMDLTYPSAACRCVYSLAIINS